MTTTLNTASDLKSAGVGGSLVSSFIENPGLPRCGLFATSTSWMTWQRSDPYAGFLFHYYSRAIHYGKGRVYTTMRCVGFQTILIRGVEWATTGKVTYPVPKDFPTASQVGLPARTPDRPVLLTSRILYAVHEFLTRFPVTCSAQSSRRGDQFLHPSGPRRQDRRDLLPAAC